MKDKMIWALKNFAKNPASHNPLFKEIKEAFEAEDTLSLLVLSKKFSDSSLEGISKIEALSNKMDKVAQKVIEDSATFDLLRVLLSESEEELALSLELLNHQMDETDYITV